MNQESLTWNPFMLMLQPEAVLAAVERSEKLGRLNRRTCHPLDRPVPATAAVDGRRGSRSDEGLDDLE
jgi:hypothetical protein